MAAQRPCAGEEERKAWLGFRRGCGWRGEVQRGCEVLKEGWAMIAACVPGKVIVRITAAISGGFGVARGRRIVELFGVI